MQRKYFILIFFISLGILILCFFIKHQKKEKISHPLTVAFDSKIISTDPRLIGSDAGSQYVEELRFLPLISFDKRGNLIHVLADKIQLEGPKIIITLKKGIHFANGTEITAFDVESTFNAILIPKEGVPPSPRKGLLGDLISVQAQGPQKIVFTLQKPDASFINNLVVGILPKTAVETEPLGNTIGKNYESGPFLLTKIEEMKWYFEANTNFDYTSKPKLKEFVIQIIPDSTTRYAALMKGDVDLIQNSLDPDKIYLIETEMQNSFDILKGTKLATTYIGFNFRDPILKQKNIREAISHAIDKESILKYRLRSDEIPASGIFSENSSYFNKALSVSPYDKEIAKSILEKSGLKLPIPLTLTVSSSNKTNIEIAKTMAANLKDVGFDVKVENLENSVFFQHLNRGLVQMWLAPWVGYKDPDHLRFIFGSNMIPPAGANRGHYSNSEVDALLEKGRVELNTKKRKEIYLKAQEILENDMPYIYLWHGMNVAVTSKRVHGYELYADGHYWSLINTTLDEQK